MPNTWLLETKKKLEFQVVNEGWKLESGVRKCLYLIIMVIKWGVAVLRQMTVDYLSTLYIKRNRLPNLTTLRHQWAFLRWTRLSKTPTDPMRLIFLESPIVRNPNGLPETYNCLPFWSLSHALAPRPRQVQFPPFHDNGRQSAIFQRFNGWINFPHEKIWTRTEPPSIKTYLLVKTLTRCIYYS